MSDNYVTDTMALVLRLEQRRLGRQVKSIFEKTEIGEAGIFIPATVLVEIGYLFERGRIETGLKECNAYLQKYNSIQLQPLTLEIIQKTLKSKTFLNCMIE